MSSHEPTAKQPSAQEGTRKQRRSAPREARRQREEAARLRQRRRRWIWWGGGGAALVALIVALVFMNRANAAPTIDGIQCNTSEGAVTHIHQHLALYLKGQPFPVPGGIGIDTTRATPCLYWLHTHASDGIIHLESPTANATYTLGQFFDIWQSPLSHTRLLTLKANGTHSIRAYVNGRLYHGDPRAIPLTSHERITLEYGPPWVTPPPFTFPAGD
jgi:hypothetical protein